MFSSRSFMGSLFMFTSMLCLTLILVCCMRRKWKWKLLSRVRLFETPWTIQSMEFSRQNTEVGSHFLLQGIFPTQEWNPGLPYCRQILYQLSHKGIPRILEWVAYPFSSGSSQPRKLNWGLLHCRQILYQLSYQRSPDMCCMKVR